MKKILIALFSLAAVSARSQSVDEVIQKYTANIGGLEALNKVTTAKMTGTFTQQTMDMPVTIQLINNKAVRTDLEAMGYQVINVYYNGSGWRQNHFAGAETPTEITGTELNDAKVQASLANPLADYKSRGHKVTLNGQEDVEGVKCYKITLVNKEDGRVTAYFISTDDYTLIKSVTTRELQGQQVEFENWFSDYKSINGLQFAMTRTQKVMGQVFAVMKYTSMELNVTIDEKIFQK